MQVGPSESRCVAGELLARRAEQSSRSIRRRDHASLLSVKRVVTIGVYEWDRHAFLEALRAGDVRVLLDVRQRRGVRGREYAWANAVRLQHALGSERVAYRHHRELAPTTELRHLQYAEDWGESVGKRSRVELARIYRSPGTRARSSSHVDLARIVAELPLDGAGAIFCVEADPEACHRSIVAERLAAEHDVVVRHLLPQRAQP